MQSNELFRTEGIVLQVTPFREYDKVLTLFTPDNGLFKLFVKGSRKSRLMQHPYTTPFAKGEYVYSQGQGLCRLHDATLLFSPLALRESLECLEMGAKFARAILKSQWQDKPSPKLYALLALFLEKLSPTSHPETLLASFLLKVLRHEGILQKDLICAACDSKIQITRRFGGECFCEKHASSQALLFSEEEEKTLFFLALGRSFSEVASFPIEKRFLMKIEKLFEQAMND